MRRSSNYSGRGGGEQERNVSSFLSDDMTLKIWDLESGRELGTLRGHSDSLYSVALSDDSRRAVSVADDHILKVWALETQSPIATFTCDAAACAVHSTAITRS
jgi:WD40 repeat protein